MLDTAFCSVDDILSRRRSLRKELLTRPDLRELRVAVLGGSTTDEFVNLFEIVQLHSGFRPVFYQSEFGRFYEDAVLDPQALIDFRPDLIYLHTGCGNLRNCPPTACSEGQLADCVEAELARFAAIWDALERNLTCPIVQNNFETPPHAILGNLDATANGGLNRFVMEMNVAFAREISRRSRVLLQDIHGISAQLGLKCWFDWNRWFSYKLRHTPEANLELARSLNSLVKAIHGMSRKVLVLDLDNTLWGGVIGDDGAEKIQIGRETPVAEAYTAFQEYCLSLRSRGILLAVCSKNSPEAASSGFEHPSSVLKLSDFSAFKANWEPKHENLQTIAAELNLGVDSLVFVDDNPAERALVQAQLPEVAVPDVGSEVSRFIGVIEQGRYFETVALSAEDVDRAALYAGNAQRASAAKKFSDYGEYLDSLQMTAAIGNFNPVYLERIAQLTNKTNQFNLTTRRYTLAAMESAAADPNCICLYGRLSDTFGDNGLISVVLGRHVNDALHLDLWLMSCRVLKREMELAMLDAIAAQAKDRGIASLVGFYFPTPKNGMVADFYPGLGFTPFLQHQRDLPDGATVWTLDLAGYEPRNKHIEVILEI